MIRKIEIDVPAGLLKYEPGYTGGFTREQAEGAWPAGTRVVKVKTEDGDTHAVGAQATVLGSLREPYGEFLVEWDALPRAAVACIGWKLEKLT